MTIDQLMAEYKAVTIQSLKLAYIAGYRAGHPEMSARDVPIWLDMQAYDDAVRTWDTGFAFSNGASNEA